jgi:hypothetical protein
MSASACSLSAQSCCRQRAAQLRDAILTIDTCGDVSQLVNFYP